MVFKFEFDDKELQLVLNGLGELPARMSMDLLGKMQKSAQEQYNAAGPQSGPVSGPDANEKV